LQFGSLLTCAAASRCREVSYLRAYRIYCAALFGSSSRLCLIISRQGRIAKFQHGSS